MDYAPSSIHTDNTELTQQVSTEVDYVDGPEDDNVIVIHEHHHHHHHNTEDEENGDNVTSSSQQEYSESSAGETPSTSESLLNNIVNDKVLYDFVSFLLDQQAKKLKELRPERRSQEIDIESYYHHTPVKQEIVAVDHEIEKFLADGFTPIVEIELE